VALHVIRSFIPDLRDEEGAAALSRVLARGGNRVEEIVSHTAAELLELQFGLRPGMRLLTHFESTAPGSPTAWVLHEATAGLESWNPWMAHELSADLGKFAVTVESSRSLGCYGYGVFFAGRTVEFASANYANYIDRPYEARQKSPVESEASLDESVYATFADLYVQLTASPSSGMLPGEGARLTSVITSGPQRELPWRPSAAEERPLSLAVFALIDEREFAAAWDSLNPGPGWFRHVAATPTSQLPYVVLTREGALDTALNHALAKCLDVSVAAIALPAPCASFVWWSAQPQEVPRQGEGQGALEFVRCLMPAMVALGERPGILHIGRG